MSTPAEPRRRGPALSVVGAIADAARDVEVLVVGLEEATTDSTGAPDRDGAADDSPTPRVAGDGLDDAASAAVVEAAVASGFTGTTGQVARIPAPAAVPAAALLLVGLGKPSGARDPEAVRRAAGAAARELVGVASAVTTLSTLDLAAAVEGMFLGAYRFDEFRSARTRPTRRPVESVAFVVEGDVVGASGVLAHSEAVAVAVTTARDFVNTPPSHLYPEEFASRAAALGEEAGLEVEVLDDAALVAGGYGGIVGVGKGSSRLPRLVRLAYSSGFDDAPKIALVGKGVTFDTGGISIKPAANMETMTSDMGGAAAVIATVVLAARLGVRADVTATVPMAENMPSATAQRPGDVLTQYGGTTVEVINTDAEGRLILADAIVRACADEPGYLIDAATLTGAQMVALGTRTPGVMGTDDFRDRVAAISRQVGENGWAMPFPDELAAELKSRVADLTNVTPQRWGGMLSAGIFLREFLADGVQWAHIDVAGPAFNTGGPWGYTPKGGTGVPVRTMIAVIEDIAANG